MLQFPCTTMLLGQQKFIPNLLYMDSNYSSPAYNTRTLMLQIQSVQVIEKECRDYKNLSFKNCWTYRNDSSFKTRRKNVSFGIVLMQDGAPPYFCQSVRKALNEKFPQLLDLEGWTNLLASQKPRSYPDEPFFVEIRQEYSVRWKNSGSPARDRIELRYLSSDKWSTHWNILMQNKIIRYFLAI
jgi:hypothetical protein